MSPFSARGTFLLLVRSLSTLTRLLFLCFSCVVSRTRRGRGQGLVRGQDRVHRELANPRTNLHSGGRPYARPRRPPLHAHSPGEKKGAQGWLPLPSSRRFLPTEPCPGCQDARWVEILFYPSILFDDHFHFHGHCVQLYLLHIIATQYVQRCM